MQRVIYARAHVVTQHCLKVIIFLPKDFSIGISVYGYLLKVCVKFKSKCALKEMKSVYVAYRIKDFEETENRAYK
jgi:hypothetical protein